MGYDKISVKEIVDEINTKYFLPPIQKNMVWDEKKIYKLFDSLLRGNPINTFLFCKINKDSKKKISAQKFIKNYTKNSLNESNTKKDEYYLVLEGQDILQALYISLIGTYKGKELYLNVLSNSQKNHSDKEILYETKFLKSEQSMIFQKYRKNLWVKVKEIVDLDQARLFDYCYNLSKDLEKDLSLLQIKLIKTNINKFNNIYNGRQVLNYKLINKYNLEQLK